MVKWPFGVFGPLGSFLHRTYWGPHRQAGQNLTMDMGPTGFHGFWVIFGPKTYQTIKMVSKWSKIALFGVLKGPHWAMMTYRQYTIRFMQVIRVLYGFSMFLRPRNSVFMVFLEGFGMVLSIKMPFMGSGGLKNMLKCHFYITYTYTRMCQKMTLLGSKITRNGKMAFWCFWTFRVIFT